MKKTAFSVFVSVLLALTLIFTALALTGCTTTNNYDSSWIVKSGAPAASDGYDGAMLLDLSTYDVYFKDGGAWTKIGNIKGEKGETGASGADGAPGASGKDGSTPSVSISEDGFWVINGEKTTTSAIGTPGKDGKTPSVSINADGYWVINGEQTEYKAGTVVDSTEKVSFTLTEEEYRQMPAFYGSCHMVTTNTRARIGFSAKMKAGTVVKFVGDTKTYKFGVAEMGNIADKSLGGYFVDVGWIENTTEYTVQKDCFPMPTIARLDNKALTIDELQSIYDMFKVTGEKATAYPATGALSREQFLEQPAFWGSFPNPTTNSRLRIIFGFKMAKGTKVTFVGDNNVYKWTVCETPHPTVNGLDIGWNVGWVDPTASTYVTNFDGAVLVLNLARRDDGAMKVNDIAKMHDMFVVEGEKSEGVNNGAEQKQYIINSVNHRGFSCLAPENTLTAYKMSAYQGFTMAECDVQFTSDNIPVLLHDNTVDRTSNGTGAIGSMTLEQAKTLDFGSWKAPKYKGEKIPTFDEFIALCRQINLHPYIEIKAALTTERAQMLVNIVKRYGMIDDVTWISFGADSLQKIVEAYDKARVGYVVNDVTNAVITSALNLRTGKNEVFIDCNYGAVGDDDIALCMKESIPLEVWTVNSVAAMQKVNPYVSGFTSDWIIAGEKLKEGILG